MAAEIYLPHGYDNCPTLSLPPLPATESTTKSTTSGIKRWISGPSRTPIEISDDEVVQAFRDRWRLKWEHYKKTFPQDSVTIQPTGVAVRERAEWLEGDVKRIQSGLWDIPSSKAPAEVLAGIWFLNGLIEDLDYDFRTLTLNTVDAQSGDDLKRSQDQLMDVHITHAFVMDCVQGIQELKWRALTEKHQPVNPDTAIRLPQASELQLDSSAVERLNDMHQLSQTLNQGNAPPATHQASSISSHKANLVIVGTISFFGASITWSTVFSGSRGNLVIISWAACLFIVAASIAGSASLLLEADEPIVEKYITVRWIVRLMTLFSAAHIFSGVLLLGLAIAVLDPDASIVTFSGPGRSGLVGAGVYAMVVSTLSLMIGILVRRRYTYRTWHIW